MNKNKKSRKEDVFSSTKIITRRVSRYLMIEKNYTPDEIMAFILELNNLELNLISSLKNRCGKIKFCPFVQQLAGKISRMPPESIACEARNMHKLISSSPDKNDNKVTLQNSAGLQLFIKLLQPYENLYAKIIDKLFFREDFNAALHMAEQCILEGKIYDERRLYIQQTIKHLNFIQHNRLELKADHLLLLKIALNADFADDISIYQDQTELLLNTYGASSDPRITTAAKKICYDFIGNIFQKHKILSGSLIIFPFLGGWISRETHELFLRHKTYLEEQGLKILVYYQTLPLYRKVEEKISDGKPLEDSDKFVLSLYKNFRD